MKKAVELQKLKRQLKEPTHPAQTAFGSLFKGEASDLQAIQIAIDWLERLQMCNLSGDVVQRLITSNEHCQKLKQRTTELQEAQRKIEEGFEFLRQNFPERVVCESEESLSRIPLARITKFLERARIDIDSFQNWLEYSKIIQKLSSFGAVSFVERLREPSFSSDEWFPALEKRVYQLWLEYIHTQESELRNFQVELHEQTIREFSQLDTQ